MKLHKLKTPTPLKYYLVPTQNHEVHQIFDYYCRASHMYTIRHKVADLHAEVRYWYSAHCGEIGSYTGTEQTFYGALF